MSDKTYPHHPDDIPIEDKARIVDLSTKLSPENLHEDGEISRADAARKREAIETEWRRIEERHGVRITERHLMDNNWLDQVENHIASVFDRRIRETRERFGTDNRVEIVYPGVWERRIGEGASKWSVYTIGRTPGGYDAYGTYVEEQEQFTLISHLAALLHDGHIHGYYGTLEDAVDAGEQLIEQATPENLRQAMPDASDKRIDKLVASLPEPILEEGRGPSFDR